MKRTDFLVFCVLCFMLSSCSFNDKTNVEREELIGSWDLSKSIRETESKTPDSIVVTGFQLYADSTVKISISIPNSSKKQEVTGVWFWKLHKEMGDSTLGIGVSTDVRIRFNDEVGNNMRILGLMLDDKADEKLRLSVNDRIYQKR